MEPSWIENGSFPKGIQCYPDHELEGLELRHFLPQFESRVLGGDNFGPLAGIPFHLANLGIIG